MWLPVFQSNSVGNVSWFSVIRKIPAFIENILKQKMVPTTVWYFISLFIVSIYGVSLHENGAIEYCNVNPREWNFKDLKNEDLNRIKKLKQLHILARHGTRVISKPITEYFPESGKNLSFNCNFSTVVSRHFKGLKMFLSFQLHFITNEGVVAGDCQEASSLSPVINQHSTNAEMVKQFYIGKGKHHLMSQTHLDSIAYKIYSISDENNENTLFVNDAIPEIKILSANYERTVTSATVFMSEFLGIKSPDVRL